MSDETPAVSNTETSKKKNPIDSQRNMFIRVQALRWVEMKHPEVFEAIKELAYKKYPGNGQRKRIELDDELAGLQ